jgi:hypothetical protein
LINLLSKTKVKDWIIKIGYISINLYSHIESFQIYKLVSKKNVIALKMFKKLTKIDIYDEKYKRLLLDLEKNYLK